MASCPRCKTEVPDGMRFCPQCGAPLASPTPPVPSAEPPAKPAPAGPTPAKPPATPPPAAPRAVPPVAAAVPPRAAPSEKPEAKPLGPGPALSKPVAPPPTGVKAAPPAPSEAPPRPSQPSPAAATRPAAPPPRVTPKPAPPVAAAVSAPAPPAPLRGATPADSSLPEAPALEPSQMKDASLEEAFKKPPVPPGTIICRFCKGPLDLAGDFCEQCGAPVAEAAPPEALKPKSPPASAPGVESPSVPAAPPSGTQPEIPAEKLAVPPGTTPKAPVTAPSKPATPPAPPATKVASPPVAPGPPPGASVAKPVAPPPVPAKTPVAAPPRPPAAPVAPPPAAPPKAAGAATPSRTAGPAPPVAAAPSVAVPPPLAVATEAGKKSSPMVLVALVIGVVLAVGGGATWYFLRSGRAVQNPPPRVATPAPASTPAPQASNLTPPAQPVPTPAPAAESPRPGVSPAAASQPRRARVEKPAPAPAAPAANPKAEQIASLQNLAREAYAKGNFAEPLAANAIAYSKQVLALVPANDYARSLLENSANGGKYQVQQAISHKDFASAHRVANALAQLLPGRSDIAGLKEDIASAERANEEARRSKPVAVAPVVSFRAYHMHSDKAPADKGPYCLGSLSVTGGRMKFTGESASEGQKTDSFDLACSDIREIKKNARVASRQNGFHARTASSNINFVPEDSSAAHISALASACSK